MKPRVFALLAIVMATSLPTTAPAQTDDLDLYITPAKIPVYVLECSESFDALTENEKLYAHWMTMASWHGALICFEQCSVESPAIFELLLRLHDKNPVALRQAASRRGISPDDLEALDVYTARFYSNTGNYLSFGDTKFIPRIAKETMATIVDAAARLGSKTDERMVSLWKQTHEKMYSLDPSERAIGLGDEGTSPYYSENITAEEIDAVKRYMKQINLDAWNTRIMKLADGTLELRIASIEKRKSDPVMFEGTKIQTVHGDFSETLARVNDAFKKALPYAANDHQRKMIEKYIEHFQGGDINAHKDSMRHWVLDKGPVVETNLGFIETYRDPVHVRAEWEGLVAMVDKAQSASFQKLVDHAGEFVKRLPWDPAFEKDTFKKPDFTSLNVLAFANGGIPAGINIPNYDEIRMNEGFKNVSLGNVLSAGGDSGARIDFICDEDQQLYRDLKNRSFKVQVGLHELLGHGSGKLLSEDSDGKKNFDPNTKNPLTGEPVATWYKAGETWGSKFSVVASSYEECRAEAVGLHLCVEKDILALFGFEGEAADDIVYVNWLSMARAGVAALTFYNPTTRAWGQAHMQARFALLSVMLEAGEGFVTLEKTATDDWIVRLDRSKIMSVGHPAIANFLTKLNVYKATADVKEGRGMYERITAVDAPMLALRDYVMSQRKPRHAWVQPVTDLDENGKVILRTYPATYQGAIDAFQDRYSWMLN